MYFIIWLLVCLALNTLVSTLVSLFIPNYYLATMITSIIIAFVYALISQRGDRLHFYKYRNFWLYFLGTAIVFLLFDALVFWLG